MNTLFKKHFWTLSLLGLALIALVFALMVNDVIAGKLFSLPSVQSAAARVDGEKPDLSFGRLADEINAAQELGIRRIFNLEPPPDPEEEAWEREQKEKEEAEETPEPETRDGLEASSLPIKLLGTFVAVPDEYSYANLTIEGEHKIASVGNEYLDGAAEIIKISPGHIVLKERAGYTYVKLWDQDQDGGSKPSAIPARPGRATPGRAERRPRPNAPGEAGDVAENRSSTSPADGVTKTGAYDYVIDRQMLDKQLENLGSLQNQARPVPHYKDNAYSGIKMVGVRPGSLYRAIGIRSGDVITSVNGVNIDNPNKALQLFEQFKGASDIKVEIERRGQPKTLGYTVQ